MTIESSLEIFLSKLNYNKELQKYFKNVKLVENEEVDEQYQHLNKKDRRMMQQQKME